MKLVDEIPYETRVYGLKPYSLDEEVALPFEVRQTRDNKLRIVNLCISLIRDLEGIKEIAKNIPELDDAEHSTLVNDYREAIEDVRTALYHAIAISRRDSKGEAHE